MTVLELKMYVVVIFVVIIQGFQRRAGGGGVDLLVFEADAPMED